MQNQMRQGALKIVSKIVVAFCKLKPLYVRGFICKSAQRDSRSLDEALWRFPSLGFWNLKWCGRRRDREFSIPAVALSIVWLALFGCFATQIFVSAPVIGAEQLPIVKLPPGGPKAATNLVAKPDCDGVNPRKAIARLSWTPAIKPGQEQRVAVTIFRDGFERGKFDISKGLKPGETNLVWDEIRGQAIHFWRVLTLHPEGWVPSVTARFEGPPCVSDPVRQSTDGERFNKQLRR